VQNPQLAKNPSGTSSVQEIKKWTSCTESCPKTLRLTGVFALKRFFRFLSPGHLHRFIFRCFCIFNM